MLSAQLAELLGAPGEHHEEWLCLLPVLRQMCNQHRKHRPSQGTHPASPSLGTPVPLGALTQPGSKGAAGSWTKGDTGSWVLIYILGFRT